MFNRINNYINDKEFKFTVYENKIHIVNFNKIITLEDNYISLISQNKRRNIKGNNLILLKLSPIKYFLNFSYNFTPLFSIFNYFYHT